VNDESRPAPGAPPLAGIRVVDFTQIAAGPFCSSLLGDLGADVIKVEPPAGEPFRRIDNVFGPSESAYFYAINRSKRSLALDLTTESGREVSDRLIQSADVCMVGFRPAAVEKLGLSWERLGELNPRLVYCSVTAFGETGPLADRPGMDIIAQALSGVMGLTGEPDRPPVKVGPPVADFVVSFLAGFAICAALRARDRDGIGQKLELNLLDGQVAIVSNYITPYLKTRIPIRPVGGGHPQIVPYQVFETPTGYMIVACLNDRFWAPLCKAIEREDLVDDERFATNVMRVRNRDALIPQLENLFRSEPAAIWLERLERQGVPCSPVHRLEDALEDPQVVHNELLVELDHPRLGPYTVVRTPMTFSRTPARISRPVADLGSDTHDVLTELGYSADEITALEDEHAT
jgi:succinate--hydroxymethylglutarate CoA-transferase